MKPKSYTRITYEERVKIETLLSQKMSIPKIAIELGKSKSSIYREINRNKSDCGWGYKANPAQFGCEFKLKTRRLECKICINSTLRFYVLRHMLQEHSPEQIANRIKMDYPDNPDMRISHESIYRYVYQETKGRMQKRLIRLLPYSKPKRSGKPKREIYMGKIIGRISISERPQAANDRSEIGHWEGDLIIGKGQTSAIGTLVERVTRFTLIIPLESRKSKHVVEQFSHRLNELPEVLRKSMTYDNGVEMAAHKTFTKKTKMPVYFANPYCSCERGTNENTNGLLRQYFPKRTDLSVHSQAHLNKVARQLNERPRKRGRYPQIS